MPRRPLHPKPTRRELRVSVAVVLAALIVVAAALALRWWPVLGIGGMLVVVFFERVARATRVMRAALRGDLRDSTG